MIRFLVFSFVVSALADQALYEAGITKVLDSLEQVVISGNSAGAGEALGKKLFVQQLLKNKLKSPALDDHSTAFIDVKEFLLGTLDGMGTATSDDQATLDQIYNAFQHCTDAWANSTGHGQFTDAHEMAVVNARELHLECRQEEQDLITAANTDCETFSNNAVIQHGDDTSTYNCASGIAESDLIGDVAGLITGQTADHYYNLWDTWFQDQTDHYNDETTKTEAEECLSDYNAWADKNGIRGSYAATSCGQLQTLYEEAFCARRVQYSIRCYQNQYCHDYYSDLYNATALQVREDDTQRLRDAAMITYVICLLDQLANQTNGGSQSVTGNATVDDIDSACSGFLTNPDPDDTTTSYGTTYGNNFTNIPARQHEDCAAATFSDDHNPTNPSNWQTVLLNDINSGADPKTFTGPFRPPNEGLCAHSFTYINRGEAYYARVYDSEGNEYWHNESLVGATNTSLPR